MRFLDVARDHGPVPTAGFRVGHPAIVGYRAAVLVQEELIARVRSRCAADRRLDAALEYGSFPQGYGDAYSDVEFWLFVASGGRPAMDPVAWIGAVARPMSVGVNEFGAHVAIFERLIRGEFHFATVDAIASVASWPVRGADVDRMIIVDRRGALHDALTAALTAVPRDLAVPDTATETEALCLRFANWLVLGLNVARRGEHLRAHDALDHVRRHLLWMARLTERATDTWLTPSRRAEDELSSESLASAHTTLDPDPMAALSASWHWGRELWTALAGRHGFAVPLALRAALDAALGR
jgi:lincosamide nucleotidyltransferase B/F